MDLHQVQIKDNVGISSLNSGNTEITDNKAKAEILSNQFKAVFTDEDVDTIPDMDSNGVSDIDPLVFQTKGIVSLLRNINAKKASGPDGISCFVLKEAAEEIAPFLQFIFNQSLTTGQVPGDWKCANVTPVFKKGSKKEACDYRLVSLTSVPCKISGAHYLPSYYGSVGRASCTCQLPALISPGPLM